MSTAANGTALHDFEKDHPTSSCVIKIKDKVFHVSSEMLGMHSHFFRGMFFREATEEDKKKTREQEALEAAEDAKDGQPTATATDDDDFPLVRNERKEITLHNIDAEHFREVLNIIYPSDKPITDDNVKNVLHIAEKYHFNVIMDEAENFLMSDSKLAKKEKLLIADEKKMTELADKVIKTMTKDEIKGISNDETLNLSDRTNRLLLQQSLK